MPTQNVVLIVLDSVRKDIFNCVAKRLKSRADIKFNRAVSPSSWTLPAHGSMFTGKLPHQHNAHAGTRSFDIDESFLNKLEVTTSAASANLTLNSKSGFRELFDTYESVYFERTAVVPGGESITGFVQDNVGNSFAELKFIKEALKSGTLARSGINGLWAKFFADRDWRPPINRRADYGTRAVRNSFSIPSEPFFGYLNFMESHLPHRPVSDYNFDLSTVPSSWSSSDINKWKPHQKPSQYTEYIKNLQDVYTATVEYLDREVSNFLEDIQTETNLHTTFIVTSDHGDHLGYEQENNTIGHSMTSVSESLVHVPLLIVDPPTQSKGNVDEPVSLRSLPLLVEGLFNNSIEDVSSEYVLSERLAVSNPSSVPDSPKFTSPERGVTTSTSHKTWKTRCHEDKKFNIPIDKISVDPTTTMIDNKNMKKRLRDLGYME